MVPAEAVVMHTFAKQLEANGKRIISRPSARYCRTCFPNWRGAFPICGILRNIFAKSGLLEAAKDA